MIAANNNNIELPPLLLCEERFDLTIRIKDTLQGRIYIVTDKTNNQFCNATIIIDFGNENLLHVNRTRFKTLFGFN